MLNNSIVPDFATPIPYVVCKRGQYIESSKSDAMTHVMLRLHALCVVPIDDTDENCDGVSLHIWHNNFVKSMTTMLRTHVGIDDLDITTSPAFSSKWRTLTEYPPPKVKFPNGRWSNISLKSEEGTANTPCLSVIDETAVLVMH
jgi:hypothetical protein